MTTPLPPPRPPLRLRPRRAPPRRGLLVANGALLSVFALAVAFGVPMPESRRVGFFVLAALAAVLTAVAVRMLPRTPSAPPTRAQRRRRGR